jgi:hypothetical protein
MQRRASSMRSEELASPQTSLLALEAQCQRLQLLVSELLLKNHELRFELARLSEAQD